MLEGITVLNHTEYIQANPLVIIALAVAVIGGSILIKIVTDNELISILALNKKDQEK